MSSPDTAAASYTDQVDTWKDRPLPPVGAGIKLTWLSRQDGRTRTMTRFAVVGFEPALDGTGHLVIPCRDPRPDRPEFTVTLSDECLLDSWTMITPPEAESLPAPVFPPAEVAAIEPAAADPHDLPSMQRRYLHVKEELAQAEAKVKALKAEKDELNTGIVDECVNLGYTKPPGVGDFTFGFSPAYSTRYLTDEETGEKYDSDAVIKALQATGLDVGIVRLGYNGNTLKAMLKERSEAELALPEALAAVIELHKETSVTVTRSAARNRRGRPALPERD